ncbi:MAG TPA: hypothetical protein PK530_05505 [Anaerolineales bacterium]|nr:hypothetical protein [Anaerolineales bacterium]
MNRLLHLTLLFLVVSLSGCLTGNSTPEVQASLNSTETLSPSVTPTQTTTPRPSATPLPLTDTPTSSPTLTPTWTPLPTLGPEQAQEILNTLLRETDGCLVPCFWGIIPEQTTFTEAKGIFAHLGLRMELINTQDSKEFFEITYDPGSNFSMSLTLTKQKDLVKHIRVYITPELDQADVPRGWLAYSPETLIAQYGLPTQIVFFVDRPRDANAEPKAWYHMVMYYENLDFIVMYGRPEIHPPLSLLPICPITDAYNNVQLWLGHEPENPPQFGVSLEEATSMTIEEFAALMTGDPDSACFELKGELFP